MKTTFNKSKIMKAAWFYFKSKNGAWDFSYCMKRAWQQEKKRIEVEIQLEEEKRTKVVSAPKTAGCPDLYTYEQFYSRSRYIGD